MKIILAVCTLALSGFTFAVKLPSDIPKCRKEDSECMVQSANIMMKSYAKGDKNTHLLSMDPLAIPRVRIEQGGLVNVLLKFKRNNVYGLKDFSFYKISGFNDNIIGKYELRLKGPRILMLGRYSVKGTVLFLPIEGDGISNITILDPDILIRFKGNSTTKNGVNYLQPNNVKLSFPISKMMMNLDNLFNGNKPLGDFTNAFLNRNWMEIWNEIRKSVYVAFSQIVGNVLMNFFSTVPYDELFAKEQSNQTNLLL